ncbi:hypothetical protein TNCV_1122221 [Trichonephila clavipes]|nr:hypothetical protein TNCV_1122221 [Trichonephila clavipes]
MQYELLYKGTHYQSDKLAQCVVGSDSVAAWNYLRSASCRYSNDELQLKERTSRTPNSSRDQNQTHLTFCLHLQRSSDMEYPCSSNVPGTTAKQRAHYDSQIHTRSAHREVYRLNTSFFNYLGKRITSDDFQKNLFSRNFPFSATYRKTIWSDFPERLKIHTGSLSGQPDDF